MGKIICEKHGDQGIVLTCNHVRQDILTGTSTIDRVITGHQVFEFVDQTVAYCDTCAKQYGLPLKDGVLPEPESEFGYHTKPVVQSASGYLKNLCGRASNQSRNLGCKSACSAVFVSITGGRQTEFALERTVESRFGFITNVFGDFRNAA